MEFAEKKVLITGVNGFIGSHLAQKLRESGAYVEGTTNHPQKTSYLNEKNNTPPIKLHALDVREQTQLDAILHQTDYDYIFHLASQSDTWKSTQEPYDTIRTNVGGTLNVLESVRNARNNPAVILAGSVRVFQYTPHGMVFDEEDVGLHPYDASKVGAEVIASSYFHTYGIKGGIARNTNTYGENDLNFSRLIPLIMKGIFTEGKIVLWGSGELSRDFMYVEDTVHGMLRLAEHVKKGKNAKKEYTFATGVNHSVKEIVETAISLVPEKKIHIEWKTDQHIKDRDQPICDITTTRKELGWEPRVALREGLGHTLQWYHHYFSTHGGMHK